METLKEKINKVVNSGKLLAITEYYTIGKDTPNSVYIEEIDGNSGERSLKLLNILEEEVRKGYFEEIKNQLNKIVENGTTDKLRNPYFADDEDEYTNKYTSLVVRTWSGIEFYTGKGYARLLEYDFDTDPYDNKVEVNLTFYKENKLSNYTIKTDKEYIYEDMYDDEWNEMMDNQFLSIEEITEIFKELYNSFKL